MNTIVWSFSRDPFPPPWTSQSHSIDGCHHHLLWGFHRGDDLAQLPRVEAVLGENRWFNRWSGLEIGNSVLTLDCFWMALGWFWFWYCGLVWLQGGCLDIVWTVGRSDWCEYWVFGMGSCKCSGLGFFLLFCWGAVTFLVHCCKAFGVWLWVLVYICLGSFWVLLGAAFVRFAIWVWTYLYYTGFADRIWVLLGGCFFLKMDGRCLEERHSCPKCTAPRGIVCLLSFVVVL